MTKETMILLGGVAIGIFSSLIPVFKKLVVKSESKVDDTLFRENYNDLHFNLNGTRYHKICKIHYKEV